MYFNNLTLVNNLRVTEYIKLPLKLPSHLDKPFSLIHTLPRTHIHICNVQNQPHSVQNTSPLTRPPTLEHKTRIAQTK